MTVCNELAAATGFMFAPPHRTILGLGATTSPQVLFLCDKKVFKCLYRSMFGGAPLDAAYKHVYVYVRGMEFHLHTAIPTILTTTYDKHLRIHGSFENWGLFLKSTYLFLKNIRSVF